LSGRKVCPVVLCSGNVDVPQVPSRVWLFHPVEPRRASGAQVKCRAPLARRGFTSSKTAVLDSGAPLLLLWRSNKTREPTPGSNPPFRVDLGYGSQNPEAGSRPARRPTEPTALPACGPLSGMPLTLEQYASYLDTRNLPWPAPPEIERPRAKPHLERLPGVRAILWNVYGTLLAVPGGELYYEHPLKFVMDVALDKTIQEFKMWGSMSRKPGQPADYLRQIYANLLDEQRTGGTEKHPEVAVDRLWEAFLKKLLQKEYRFDAGFYGSLNEFSRKVAYFFHASLQSCICYPEAATALRQAADNGLTQGLLADGQCFTAVQLQRGLQWQDASLHLDQVIDPNLRILSYELRTRKPSERLFREALQILAERGVTPEQVLHLGSRVQQDVVPARRAGMRTGLFAGDRASLQATPEQLKEPASRPDVLLTELSQVAEVVSGEW